MSEPEHHQLIILGSGPAGYTAAIYAARANLKPVLISGFEPGGQLTSTTEIDNWPGDYKGVEGPELMERMKLHAERFDTKMISDHVIKTDLSRKPFFLKGSNGEYTCDSLIIATGASAKYLGLESEQKFKDNGVSACATCDGFLYQDEPVAVIGGGSSALSEALYLTNVASHVTVIHRRDKFRSEKILADKLNEKKEQGTVSIEWNNVLEDVVGDNNGVNSIKIKNVKDGSIKEINVKAVFIAIGHSPNTDIFKDQLEMENNYIITRKYSDKFFTQTSIPGVFAAGDVQDNIYRQAVTSAGTGCMAAMDAERYLEGL
ncbi:MAG TPA: thioredoxin-disulfide reductase [Flexistipes sinusarabici]|uniref:Thioredoxin reductase n=1 Tax=Flexistipes sinusarabici TaxID=2352 RepID=A0A3D5Q9H1_FLESI|nr:thioredoxin-disulfide reductase [Flexistipes sinusarabici]